MKYKCLFVGLSVVFLNGCSEFYGYQPPAPIYGEGKTTNPYAINRPIPTIVDSADTTVKPTVEPKKITTVKGNSSYPEQKVVLKRIAPPAILALVSEADRSSKAGDLESAVATIERALRIDSRNPALTYKLAKLRLKQSKPRLAEDLAKKAAILAVNDREIKKQSWLLISEARRRQKKYLGAKEAKQKADSL